MAVLLEYINLFLRCIFTESSFAYMHSILSGVHYTSKVTTNRCYLFPESLSAANTINAKISAALLDSDFTRALSSFY